MENSHNLMDNVDEEKAFVLEDGTRIVNILQLIEKIKIMDDKSFKNHVNQDKNDFANWIKHVYKDNKLSDEISMISNKNILSVILEEKIKEINSKTYGNIIKKIKETPSEKDQISQKLELIMEKEQKILEKQFQISLREKKIAETEHKMEHKMESLKNIEYKDKFFTKDFIQGFAIGGLAVILLTIIFLRF